MIKCKRFYLATASVIALGIGAAAPAQAFDEVNWSWDKDVQFTEFVDISITDSFDLSGMVEVEKIQVNLGDITATSTVTGVYNEPPGEDGGFEGGTYQIEELFELEDFNYSEVPQNQEIDLFEVDGSPDGLLLTVLGGEVDESNNLISTDLLVTGEIELEPTVIEGPSYDAIDLPSVESAAAAIGNNQSIESSVAVALHDAQINAGDISFDSQSGPGGGLGLIDTGNTHTDFLVASAAAAAGGILTQGVISADSTVSDILNASVDSSATAVGNNISVDLDAYTEGDAYLVADLMQFNYADVSATSSVSDINVLNYENLGVLEMPMVSSVATAIGNNAAISVSSPSLPDVGTP